MYWVKTPSWIQSFFPQAVFRLEVSTPCIYLTFDDGPTPHVTDWVLSQLAPYDAKATFFCLGKQVEKYPDLFQAIQQQGHQIGNHSYHHFNGLKTATSTYLADVEKAKDLIDSNLFRPPYGQLKWSQYQALKQEYRMIFWEVMAGDFDEKVSKEKCLQRIYDNMNAGSILVLHDSLKCEEKVRFVLPRLLEYYTERGYRFLGIE